MWWLDPGKEVLNVLFNRILAPYVQNLDLNQVNYGIAQGQLTLRNLRLKKGALDKFQLPLDVHDGHLGKFTLSLHWMNLGNQPVEILIEDVYLLVVPSPHTSLDPEEDAKRIHAAKMERLESAELLHIRGQVEAQEEKTQSQGLVQSIIAKVINNVQITVKNIHIRYEDDISVPGHPFAAGITLASFTAVSVNENWLPSFIESNAGAIHKLAKLQSLSVYFDTDSTSMIGLPPLEAIKRFFDMISHHESQPNHQYILKPVSGEGRIVVNHKVDKQTPRFDIQLLFEEIGVALDNHQYRDVISLLDMYHVNLRKRQYGKYRPIDEEIWKTPAKARLLYAGKAILEGVREKNQKWTWSYFAGRRDDRNAYVDLFQRKELGTLVGPDLEKLTQLEAKLSYEDIRFYRSIARSRLKKDAALRKRLENEKKQSEQQKQTWSGWLWGSSADTSKKEDAFTGEMTEEQRKQLYDVLDYDEKTALVDALQAPRDSLKMRVVTKLNKGSFTLISDPHGKKSQVMSVVFEVFGANFIQRPSNFEASVSLDGFRVFDGTTKNTLHPQIVRVKEEHIPDNQQEPGEANPFFFAKFESKPLDERADNALIVRMRHMEIIYHRNYVEAIYKFFKPPASQLESVEALLNVASETLEGLRKETRAGLEYALQTHKTIDLQMDMNAPIIIIPEDVTTYDCQHLIIDAGHISIESDLASKEAIRTIHQKRNQKYTDEDYKQLESLMYDKMSLRLDDAQFILGDNLQLCREALTSKRHDSLHLLERISIDLRVDNSIVPKAVNLAQLRISGKLPSLQINFSDTKYKALMRLIDVSIPHFDNSTQAARPRPVKRATPGFQLPLFGPAAADYTVDDEEERKTNDTTSSAGEDEFFEAEEGEGEFPEYRQHTIEIDFSVDTLRANVAKSGLDGVEKPLGQVELKGFALAFSTARYNMDVNVKLRSMSMNVIQRGGQQIIQFVTTPATISGDGADLLKVVYTRAQKESPEFNSKYEGIEQNVDVVISTLVFRAAPEPVLSLYDFIMSTFVSVPGDLARSQAALGEEEVVQAAPVDPDSKIRVLAKFEGVQLVLLNEDEALATLALSTADVAIIVRPKTLRVSGRLGSLSLSNENKRYHLKEQFNQLVSIEGKNFADFTYQTFDQSEENYDGVGSSVLFNAASMKLHFLEGPLHDLYLFSVKLARLKGLYDAATQVAVQTASEINKLHFKVSIKTPIVVIPANASISQDCLVLRLGEIGASNVYEDVSNNIQATLKGIQLVSIVHKQDAAHMLKMIEDIDITASVVQTSNIDRSKDQEFPDTHVKVDISDVRLALTQSQYVLLMNVLAALPRLFVVDSPEESRLLDSSVLILPSESHTPTEDSSVALQPELRVLSSSHSTWTTLDLVVTVNAVKLHLYGEQAYSEQTLREHGIARFALNGTTLRMKNLSNSSSEIQIVLKSFTMSNTRPGQSKFREIIPAAQHDRNQFMLLYTTSGQPNSSSLAILTVDAPQIIFAVDPVILLLEFFVNPTGAPPQPTTNEAGSAYTSTVQSAPAQGTGRLDFRLDLHDVSICVLENDANPESQAIKLHIDKVLLSQQGILALIVEKMGMSLMQMGHVADSVKFLDDLDLKLTLDSQFSTSQQTMSIEIGCTPVVFRASYRDINLITSIVNKAIELYTKSQQSKSAPKQGDHLSLRPSDTSTARRPSQGDQRVGKARVLISKEQLSAKIEGFRLVLIGDLHEQPMFHVKIKTFEVSAQDWSNNLRAVSSMTMLMTYWNLTNSHWEPLIDPWTFTLSVGMGGPTAATELSLAASQRLDINLSTTFAEIAINTLNTWAQEGAVVLQKARATYAPYRIRNETGSTIHVWSDVETNASIKDIEATKVLQGQTIDWRFDDWRALRENVSIGQHNIGVEFVDKPWEQLRGIPVDREGEYVYSLRPRVDKFPTRLLCEISVVDMTKIITIRSTYKIENLTLYPLELMLVDDNGRPVHSLVKILPSSSYSLPIDAVTKHKIRLQPDQGFGYKWGPAIRFEDLIQRKSFTVKCPHADPSEAAFRLQAWVQTDINELNPRKYPKINLRLRAPLELENLLPYNLEYRIYDKNTDQNWRSYLRKGGNMPVHSVELGHFILLSVTVQDTVFKQSDFAIINTDGHSDFDIEDSMVLQDQRDRKLKLKLNYVRYPDSGGAFKLQIYSPYIVINKTGLPFYVKSTRSARTGTTDAAGDADPANLATSTPFLLSHSHKDGNEFLFKFAQSAWSKVASFEAPSADTEMVMSSQSQQGDDIYLGISWTEGSGKYKIVKVITLTPRFLVKNMLSVPIAFREHGVPPRQDKGIIAPNDRSPFFLLRSKDEKLFTVAYPGINAHWSPPINMEDIGRVYFRLRQSSQNGRVDLIRADIQIEGGTIFIHLSHPEDGWPFVINNMSDYFLEFAQQDAVRDQRDKNSVRYSLEPRTETTYAWDYPAAKDKKIVLFIGNSRRTVDIMEIGNLMPFRFNDQQRHRVVSLDVRADGEKQVLTITNYNADQSLYKPRQRSNSVSIQRQDTMSSSTTELFEAVTEDVSADLALTIELAGVGISLVNRRLVEVIYMVTESIKLEYTNSAIAQAVTLACGHVQVDNQLHEALYPVILQPTPLGNQNPTVGALPTVQASLTWLKDQEHGVLFIKYCSILLQALTIEADEDLLFALFDLIQIKGASWETSTPDVLIQSPDVIPEPDRNKMGQELYFEVLELQPIKLSLSFMRTERVTSEEKLSIRNPVAVLVNAVTMAVGNINDAPLEMNALVIKDMRLTMTELQDRMFYHYRQDVLRQLYRILGSADFIGNPVGLFTNVSSGVADIFYEPFQGVVVHGNRELGIGIAKGAASFVKKTVFGVSDSFSKFTSSVGKGLSAATFDSDYQAKRRMAQRRNRPRHAIYGVAAGGEALASSVTSAVEGVFLKPIEGVETEGAFGFFKGVGKGLVGAVTKPVVGVFDLAANVSAGIRNTTTVFDNPEKGRVRLARHLPADGVLRSYDDREAQGQAWMRDLENGVYRKEYYVAHINSPGADNVILLTSTRVLSFWSRKLRLEWDLPFSLIQGVTVEDTGIRFASKQGKEQDKFAFIPEKTAQSWFFNQVASVVRVYNARRRMDS